MENLTFSFCHMSASDDQAPALPQKRKTRHGKELTLVLDLDETLVHCTVDPINNPDHRFEVHFNGEEFQVSLGA